MFEIFISTFVVVCIYRNKIALSLIGILLLYYAYWLFGKSIAEFPMVHNIADTANILLLILIVKLSKRQINRTELPIKSIKRGVVFFMLFLLVAILVDILINEMPLVSQFKMIRSWIPILLLLFVNKIDIKEAYSFARYLIITTLIFSIIYILEFYLQVDITGAIRTLNGARASLPWPLALLCFAFFLFSKMGFSSNFRLLFFAVLFFNIVICGSRSFFISYVVVFLLYYLTTRFSVKKLLVVAVIAASITVVFNTDNILSKRFEESKSDIASLQAGTGEVEGNLSFRLLLTLERLMYICESPQYVCFGIGNVEERNITKPLFYIGLPREDGLVYQIDTGDIAWSLAFLRWGIIGTIIYISIFYFRFLHYFYVYRRNTMSMAIIYFLITELFVISFTYPEIVRPIFWIPIIMLMPCCSRKVSIEGNLNKSCSLLYANLKHENNLQ